jgi:hypothetical protein
MRLQQGGELCCIDFGLDVDSGQLAHFRHGVAEVLQGAPRDLEEMQVIGRKQVDLVKRVFQYASPAFAQGVVGLCFRDLIRFHSAITPSPRLAAYMAIAAWRMAGLGGG